MLKALLKRASQKTDTSIAKSATDEPAKKDESAALSKKKKTEPEVGSRWAPLYLLLFISLLSLFFAVYGAYLRQELPFIGKTHWTFQK